MRKIKTIVLLALFVFVTLVISCASGTAFVTGNQRAPTNPDDITIYTEPPLKYEVIGLVTASSDSGWTEQGDLNYAMAELKKQAAKIGANGVILESVTTSNSGGVMTYGVYSSITSKNVSGKAIFVFEIEN